MRKILAALAAAGLLVTGAFTAAAVSTPGAASAQDVTDESPEPERPDRPKKGDVIGEVLGGLVADGAITQDQADQILTALQEKFAEMREDRPMRRPHHRPGFGRGFGPGFGDLLDDGVIDADELAGLPDDHPLNDPDGPAAEYLDDGELTVDELRELHEQRRTLRDQRRAENGAEALLTA